MLTASDREEGFATVDAMMAMIILSITIALVLAGGVTARRLSNAAFESRQADQLLVYLINDGAARPGRVSGSTAQFSWTLGLQAEGSGTPPVCRRSAQATAIRSGRRYILELDQICPSRLEAGQ